jgi:hypothetical protein
MRTAGQRNLNRHRYPVQRYTQGNLLAKSLEARGFVTQGDNWIGPGGACIPMIDVRNIDNDHFFQPDTIINDILTAIDLGIRFKIGWDMGKMNYTLEKA